MGSRIKAPVRQLDLFSVKTKNKKPIGTAREQSQSSFKTSFKKYVDLFNLGSKSGLWPKIN